MTRIKIAESETKEGLNQNRLPAVNPYDAIVATLNGETIVQRHVEVWTRDRNEGIAIHKPKLKRAA